MQTIRLGTRGSKLALRQAELVSAALAKASPGIAVELVTIKTTGDKILDSPLSAIGDKGLFTKEIEQALLDRSIDIAAHSCKDLPSLIPGWATAKPGSMTVRFAVSARPAVAGAAGMTARAASSSTSRTGTDVSFIRVRW